MSSSMLPPVVAELRANIDEFKSKMREARSEMSETESKGSGSFSKLGVAAVAGVGIAAVAVAGFAKESVGKFEEVAGSVAKMERLTGESAETMSRLKFAAQETGIDADKLTGGIVKLEKSIGNNNKAFAANGIAITDANGKHRAMSDVLLDVAEKFKNMPDGVDKTALAIKLFGKSGADMIPLLNKGKEGIAEFGKESDKFGLTLGQKNVDDFKKNVAAHRTMSAAWEGLQVQLGSKLMPIVAKVTSWMAEMLPKALDLVRRGVEALRPTIQTVVEAFHYFTDVILPKVVSGLKASFGWLMDHKEFLVGVAAAVGTGLAAMFVTWAVGAASAAAATVAAAAPFIAIGVAIAAVVAGVIYAYKHWAWFRDTIQAVKDFIVNDLVPAFKAIWGFISEHIIPIVKEFVEVHIAALILAFDAVRAIIMDVVVPAFKAIVDTIVTVAGWVGTKVGEIVGFITGLPGRIGSTISGLWDGMKDGITTAKNWVSDRLNDVVGFAVNLPGRIGGIFAGMWDGIKDAFRSALNWVIRHWDSLKFTLPSIDLGPFGKIGGWTVGVPQIPEFHTGGIVQGAPGQDVLARLRPGETVRTVQQEAALQKRDDVTVINNFNGVTDQQALAKQVAVEVGWALRAA